MYTMIADIAIWKNANFTLHHCEHCDTCEGVAWYSHDGD